MSSKIKPWQRRKPKRKVAPPKRKEHHQFQKLRHELEKPKFRVPETDPIVP
jgi:hypothetical protein